jgi:dUTP pyrophosphatase
MDYSMLMVLVLVGYNFLTVWCSPYYIGHIIFLRFLYIILTKIYKNYLKFDDYIIIFGYISCYLYVFHYESTYVSLVLFGSLCDYINATIAVTKKPLNRTYIKYTSCTNNILSLGTPDSAGLDIRSIEDIDILPGEIVKIKTGIRLEIPKNYFCLLANRSSMSLKNLIIMGGIIDSDYRGEIIVMLKNLGNTTYTVNKNDKIAQLICLNHIKSIKKVLKLNDNTLRRDQGFGHTGN